ncbi:MAG: prolyl oligopeptidase family serine peptidase [Kiritimatiellae bacterium]|nr:prolyl oligopeptidase family serine peptidase [Kiritimatiellia bacterium]
MAAKQLVSMPVLDEVTVPAQDVVGVTGRTVKVYIRYPEGRINAVKASTGLMLSLHNWGGLGFIGAPAPEILAQRYDVVAIGVDYFQSGDQHADIPYDSGCYQAGDALRGLYYVFQSLVSRGIAFDNTRIYVAGGSGGGNVSLMANKLAPHTFACVISLSGMASLSDDIAFNLRGAGFPNARYSRDPISPSFLSKGMQELRDPGNPAHLALAAKWRNSARIVVVHGRDDTSCLYADMQRVVGAMQKAGLDVSPHYIYKQAIDGALIKDSGHTIGDRTALLERFAGTYLAPSSSRLCRLRGPSDFERRSILEFPTSDGVCKVSYAKGLPEITFNK